MNLCKHHPQSISTLNFPPPYYRKRIIIAEPLNEMVHVRDQNFFPFLIQISNYCIILRWFS
jgi:hypothetical protein